MQAINLERLEKELRKRLAKGYYRGRKQEDLWDRKTNFIYSIRSFSRLLQAVEALPADVQAYALNRWLNFWSAKGVEQIFASSKRVKPDINPQNKLIDFTIDGLPFDHKTSVFPQGFGKPWEYAKRHKRELIEWLYLRQSQQGRKHLQNRLFVVLYDNRHGEHWHLKAEISLIKVEVERYLEDFSEEQLEKFDFGHGDVLADVIWVYRA